MSSMSSDTQRTTFNILTGYFTMGIGLLVSFFLSPYIVKTLGEVANGYTQLASNFISYASLITLAFNSMAGRFMSVAYHKNDIEKANSYFSSVILCNVILIVVFALISVFAVFNLEKIIVIEDAPVKDVKILFSFVFANFLVSLITSIYNASFFVINKLYLQNNIQLIHSILNATILLILFSNLEPKIYFVSLVAFVLSFLSIPLRMYYQRKNLPEFRFKYSNFNFKSLKELLLSGIWNTINQCGHLLMTGMDLLLCNLFIDPATMGVLAVSKSFPSHLFSIASTLNSSLSPSLTITWARDDKKELLTQLRRSMKLSSVIVSIPIMTFVCFSVPFYELWMPTLDAKELALYSFLTCMSMIPWAGPQTLYNVFTAANKLKANAISFFTTGILNILIVFVLLKYTTLGVIAVAGVSSTLSIIRNFVFTAPYTAKILGFKWYEFYKDALISVVCCAINALIAIVIETIIIPQSWITLIICVAITCVITLAVEMFVVLNKSERKLLIEKILKK